MTDRPNRFGLVLDCADPERLAEFWTAALDYVNVGSAGAYVALHPRDGNGPLALGQGHIRTTSHATLAVANDSLLPPA